MGDGGLTMTASPGISPCEGKWEINRCVLTVGLKNCVWRELVSAITGWEMELK